MSDNKYLFDMNKNRNQEQQPFDEFKNKFKQTSGEIKTTLQNISANIKNYTNEISRLEDFLGIINEHENNYNNVIQRFNNLKKKLEETIHIENIIKNLSANQYFFI